MQHVMSTDLPGGSVYSTCYIHLMYRPVAALALVLAKSKFLASKLHLPPSA